MSTTSFARPVNLPVFIDDVRQPDILCAGAIYHAYPYDGRVNRVELTPIRYDARFIGAIPALAVGQSYTIPERDLRARIAAAEYPYGITCAACHRHWYGARNQPDGACCCDARCSECGSSREEIANEVASRGERMMNHFCCETADLPNMPECRHVDTYSTPGVGVIICRECGMRW